jgi:hypothetical protein
MGSPLRGCSAGTITLACPAAAESAARARFSVEQFHRVCEAVPEQRLERIGGKVLEGMPA